MGIYVAGILVCDTCKTSMIVPIVQNQQGSQIRIQVMQGLPQGWVPSQLQPGVLTCDECAQPVVEEAPAKPGIVLS